MADDISTEIWANVPGFPGYQVSTFGNVRSCRHLTRTPGIRGYYIVLRQPWTPMTLIRNRYNYMVVGLCIAGKKRLFRVHALVLMAHVGPRPPGHCACHNDGNRLNNYLSNLRWDTPSANTVDSVQHGTAACLRVGENSQRGELTADQVRAIRRDYIPRLFGYRAVAAKHGVSEGAVRNVVSGRTWSHLVD